MKIENYINKSPVFCVINLARLTQNKIKEDLNDVGLTYYQALILVTLFVEPNNTIKVKELTEVFPITKGAISHNVSALEAKAYIRRNLSDDKRITLLKITDEGSKLAQKIMGLFEKNERLFEKVLSDKTILELEQLKLQLED